MKKLIMILSALLCLAMLFVSCDSTPVGETDPVGSETTAETTVNTQLATEPEPETQPEPIPENLNVDYDAIIAQWSEYINFGDTEEDASNVTELKQLISHTQYDNESFNVSKEGNLVLFSYSSVTYDTVYDVMGEEPVEIRSYRYNVFNVETGEEIYSTQYSYRYYAYRTGADRYEYYSSNHGQISLAYGSYGVLRVQNTAIKYIEAVMDEEIPDYVISPARWETTTTYSYYDQEGNLLIGGLETDDFAVVAQSNAYYTIIRIGNKYFTCGNGEIIADLGNEMEVRLDFINLYPDVLEYNGFQYVLNENDGFVKVLDTATNRVTVDWAYEDYFDQRNGYLIPYILGNGNILFEQGWVDNDGFLWGDTRYTTIYKMVDVKTGEISDVNLTCEIDGETYEYAIYSLTNNINGQNHGISLKDGDHQYAEIYLLSDGMAALTPTAVILDSNLQVVATLDSFVKDQTGIDYVLDNGDLLIHTDSRYYAVDIDGNGTQKIQQYVSPNTIANWIEGGFYTTGGILYNNDLKPLINLNADYSSWSKVENGVKALSTEDRCYHYLTIGESGNVIIKYSPETGTYLSNNSLNYSGCTIYKSVDLDAWSGSDTPYVFTVYNAQGQKIATLHGETWTVTNGMLKITSGSTSTYYILK